MCLYFFKRFFGARDKGAFFMDAHCRCCSLATTRGLRLSSKKAHYTRDQLCTMCPDGNTNAILWKYNVSWWKYKYIITEIQCIPMEIQMQYYRNTMDPDGNTITILWKYNVSRWKYKYNIIEIQCVLVEIQIHYTRDQLCRNTNTISQKYKRLSSKKAHYTRDQLCTMCCDGNKNAILRNYNISC